MSDGGGYYYPPQPFFLPQQEESQAVGPQCDSCEELFEDGEEAIELFHGKVGQGKKSGRYMVLETGLREEMPPAMLHPWCVANFVWEHICEPEEEPEPLCSACEAKLSD